MFATPSANSNVYALTATLVVAVFMLAVLGPNIYVPIVRLAFGHDYPTAWSVALKGLNWDEARRRLGPAADDRGSSVPDQGRHWVVRHWWGEHELFLQGTPCCEGEQRIERVVVQTCAADLAPFLALFRPRIDLVCRTELDSRS